MNNLLSYCGLVDAKIRASDIDLPLQNIVIKVFHHKTMHRTVDDVITNMTGALGGGH